MVEFKNKDVRHIAKRHCKRGSEKGSFQVSKRKMSRRIAFGYAADTEKVLATSTERADV